MAPPEHTFLVSELENQVHSYTVDLKEKNRKLGKNFDLKDCALYELIQYSCTTPTQQREIMKQTGGTPPQMNCFPFARLFRRCGEGEKMFHVETTAWEGPNAWPRRDGDAQKDVQTPPTDKFARYTGFRWSRK